MNSENLKGDKWQAKAVGRIAGCGEYK